MPPKPVMTKEQWDAYYARIREQPAMLHPYQEYTVPQDVLDQPLITPYPRPGPEDRTPPDIDR